MKFRSYNLKFMPNVNGYLLQCTGQLWTGISSAKYGKKYNSEYELYVSKLTLPIISEPLVENLHHYDLMGTYVFNGWLKYYMPNLKFENLEWIDFYKNGKMHFITCNTFEDETPLKMVIAFDFPDKVKICIFEEAYFSTEEVMQSLKKGGINLIELHLQRLNQISNI